MTDCFLTCSSCGVPYAECFEEGESRPPMLVQGEYEECNWWCSACVKESSIQCSHCDEIIPDKSLPTKPLDDESFLCKVCEPKLLEELDDFTNMAV